MIGAVIPDTAPVIEASPMISSSASINGSSSWPAAPMIASWVVTEPTLTSGASRRAPRTDSERAGWRDAREAVMPDRQRPPAGERDVGEPVGPVSPDP